MYKLIACDLDETLLNSNKEVSEPTRLAITKARAKGVRFVPASGRGFTMMEDIMQALDIKEAKDEYVISYNGGIITENKNQRIVSFTPFDYQLAVELFALGLEFETTAVSIYNDTDKYMYRTRGDQATFANGLKANLLDYPTIDFAQSHNLVKLVYDIDDATLYQPIYDTIMNKHGQDVTVSFSSGRFIEINSKGVNKGVALLKLADMLNIKPEETLAIGDDLNDLAMIEVAGLGIAVGNARKQVKKAANIVMPQTNDEDVVAAIIEKYVL